MGSQHSPPSLVIYDASETEQLLACYFSSLSIQSNPAQSISSKTKSLSITQPLMSLAGKQRTKQERYSEILDDFKELSLKTRAWGVSPTMEEQTR